MKRNQVWINTRVELQWDKELQQYVEVSTEGYWADAEDVAYAHGTPAYDQDAYAWYNDGTESGSTIIGTANNSQTLDADTTYLIRFVIQETAGADGSNLTAQLEYDVNNSGTWNNVTSTSNNVRAVASTNLTDGNDTTQRLGAGTFISPNGGIDSGDGAAGGSALDITANNESEVLYAIQLRSADLANNDTIQLRVAGLNSYTNTANATASVPDNKVVTLNADALVITEPGLSVNAEVITTPSADALVLTNGSLTVTQISATTVTLNPDTLTVSNGSLGVNAETATDLTADTLAVSNGSLAVQVDRVVNPTPDALVLTEGSLTVSQTTNVEVTLNAQALTITEPGLSVVQGLVINLTEDTLTISNGSLSVAADVTASLTPDSLVVTEGNLTVSQGLSVTPNPQSITITPNTLAVDAETAVTLNAATLTLTEGSLTVDATVNQFIDLSADALTITNGSLTVLTGGADYGKQIDGVTLKVVSPNTGIALYYRGSGWHSFPTGV